MRTIDERRCRDVSAARWVARLMVPGEFAERVNLSSAEIRFECESHRELWVLRKHQGALPQTDGELDALLQKARREGAPL